MSMVRFRIEGLNLAALMTVGCSAAAVLLRRVLSKHDHRHLPQFIGSIAVPFLKRWSHDTQPAKPALPKAHQETKTPLVDQIFDHLRTRDSSHDEVWPVWQDLPITG